MKTQTVQLRICTVCGTHGQIVRNDGFGGPELYDKGHAEAMIAAGLSHRVLKKSEASILRKAVQKSKLPEREHCVQDLFKFIESWNDVMAIGIITDYIKFHEAFERWKN